MKIVEIARHETPDGTFGQLFVAGRPVCLTLERCWIDNQPNVSCIPTGEYICKRMVSPSFGPTWQVMNVPGRTHILFHCGNIARHSKGCIIYGTTHGEISGHSAVLGSKAAKRKFEHLMRGETEFKLIIRRDSHVVHDSVKERPYHRG